MSEELTKDLTQDEMLRMILAELADLREWRAKVDAFIDDRTRDTRPMLDRIHKELADTRVELEEMRTEARERFERLEMKLSVLTDDILTVRAGQRSLAGRVDDIERRL